MIAADGHYVDGSWLLTVHIDDLGIDRQVRVQGDWSVGEVLAKLTEGLPPPTFKPAKPTEINLRSGTPRIGWAEHCLWWPAKHRWLLHGRVSLNQYGLQADARLRLVPIYGRLHVQLPDLQLREFVDVNYAEPVFRITVSICRHLNIRHPEELSLAHPISQSDLKQSRLFVNVVDRRYHSQAAIKRSAFQRSATIGGVRTQSKNSLTSDSLKQAQNGGNLNNTRDSLPNGTARKTLAASDNLFGPPRIRDSRVRNITNWSQPLKNAIPSINNVNFAPGSIHTLAFEFRALEDPSLAFSPVVGVEEAFCNGSIVHPQNFLQRLRLNSTWLDSAKSLMEQGIDMRPCTVYEVDGPVGHVNGQKANSKDTSRKPIVPTLVLRYKYGSFYDLNAKYDIVRINQLYEQAKWSVISELIEATDDEACLLAALQAHVEIATEREEQELTENATSLPVNGPDQPDSATQAEVNQSIKKKLLPLVVGHNRDTSPIGGYLRHSHNPRLAPTRPLSVVELESEIDAILDDLSNYDTADAISIGGGRRSRARRRSVRPVSQALSIQSEEQLDPGPPKLTGYIKVCKPRRFGLKMFRRVYMVADGLKLSVYKNEDEFVSKTEAFEVIYLPGCEVQPDLCLTSERYSIRLFVPISRTNLPLSAAFNLGAIDDARGQEEEIGISGRLKRRASLLSLTSLSQFGASFGLQPAGGSSGGALCGASAAVLGLVNEIVLRLPDTSTYADWLAFLRLATAVPLMGLPTGEDRTDWDGTVPHAEWACILTREIYDAERKAISGLVQLISPSVTSGDKVDGGLQVTALHNRLEKRFADFLPMRLTPAKNTLRQKTRDFIDSGGTLGRTATLPPDGRTPTHASGGVLSGPHRANLIRRICVAYSRIHDLNSIQAKMKYISAWEQMPNHGIAFFPARLEVTLPLSSLVGGDEQNERPLARGVPWLHQPLGGGNITVSSSRRVEAVGIGPTRVFRCDIQTGDIMSSWRLSAIQGWHINWELGELVLLLAPPQLPPSKRGVEERERSVSPPPAPTTCPGRVIIRPVDVSVRTVAEFLGGYTFLNLRSPEKNQGLDESVFYKLTTGSTLPLSQGTLS
ncbi:hypothetical protein CRM22_009251 [Opisthorchis felineus]|uniref:Band 4.1 domain-containing protein n=1 Tax=Opisthorchis felineus TaxID=147828 RepID=A0A4S2L893_OPIFE|nr:hypothetical protein CRM22_009251 [Opisthorchis felineus]